MKPIRIIAIFGMLCGLTITGHAQDKAGEGKKKKAGAAAELKIPESVKIERDLVYAKYGAREVTLDMYLPKQQAAKPVACIVVIHGGGWKSGDKQRFARQAAYLADKGYAAACIGYRLMPEVEIADCVKDCKAAVRWVRANAGKYHIDPDRIGTIGGSAGGHLVAMLGTSYKADALEGEGGNPGISSRVQAVVAMAPVTDFTAFGRAEGNPDAPKISPVTYVDKDSAPLLLLHGDKDTLVPLAQSEILLAKYQQAGAAAELYVFKDMPHGFWNQACFDETMDRSTRFFNKILAAKP